MQPGVLVHSLSSSGKILETSPWLVLIPAHSCSFGGITRVTPNIRTISEHIHRRVGSSPSRQRAGSSPTGVTMRNRCVIVLIALGVIVMPVLAGAQVLGSVAGTVRDASGAVLPGVTVEAGSPVLIEKVRTAVTDGAGHYQIVNLPPGAYSVSFTLP